MSVIQQKEWKFEASYVAPENCVLAASDAGLMMQNLMLSAHAHGLGTCAQGAVGIWEDVVRKEFVIPKEYRLLCGIALVYPSDSSVNKFAAHRIDVEAILAQR